MQFSLLVCINLFQVLRFMECGQQIHTYSNLVLVYAYYVGMCFLYRHWNIFSRNLFELIFMVLKLAFVHY
jgi:hypothetical protein